MADKDFTDPREVGGDIMGDSNPFERDAVVINTERALLPDSFMVSTFERRLTDELVQPMLAMMIEGRINQTKERARLLLMFDTDGAAAVVSEIVGIASRDVDIRRKDGDDDDVANGFGAQFKVALDERIEKLPKSE